MLPEIIPHIPPHRVYCEPFAGGASVFWAKPLANLNILNDTNLAIYKFYKVAVNQPDELCAALETTLFHHEEHRRARIIVQNPESYSDTEVAVALFVSCRLSYAGIPGNSFGRTFSKANPANTFDTSKKILANSLHKLRNALIDNIDALELIGRVNNKSKDAFMFIDPPYYNSDCGHYSGYTEDDFVKLLDLLSESPHHWMLTCYPNPHIEGRGWGVRLVETQNKTIKTRNKTEAIVTNYKIYNNQYNLYDKDTL